ncbi:uncharacterized protein SOCEGT47_000610 [Sorangium cellulosum]|uniref:Secreted protein n=1 Tax=Sorangium cellulosum TaxID=56 RepID=A0A4P2PSR4_SORCE|nr:hypothetical protein [Sorangium cellulosum]AUX19609.1 uncharacterized protein SOCEGT47_000610 [Sorangium cellulosum]
MRKLIQFIALLCVLPVVGGCSTAAMSSAPAAPGYVYVTGYKVNPFIGAVPQMWMCPDQPGNAECVPVEVTEVDE